jgi:hypothetical protein
MGSDFDDVQLANMVVPKEKVCFTIHHDPRTKAS